jgi:hypothetical protein
MGTASHPFPAKSPALKKSYKKVQRAVSLAPFE